MIPKIAYWTTKNNISSVLVFSEAIIAQDDPDEGLYGSFRSSCKYFSGVYQTVIIILGEMRFV